MLRLCFKALRRWPSLLPSFRIFAGGFGAPKRHRLPEVAKVIHRRVIESVFRDAGAGSFPVADAFGRRRHDSGANGLRAWAPDDSALLRFAQAAFAVFSAGAVSMARM